MPKIASWSISAWAKSLRRIEARFLRGGSRRLQLAVSGRMYVFLTIGVGLAALLANNNVLFWMESLLLGGLILSGLLSEFIVSGVRVEWRRLHAFAQEPLHDLLEIENLTRFPLIGIEICELRETDRATEMTLLTYVPWIAPRQKLTVRANAMYATRGEHAWDAIAVRTGFPFGLAWKAKLLPQPNTRLILPKRDLAAIGGAGGRSPAPLEPLLDGSLRLLPPTENPREVYWPKSLLGEQKFGRPRAREESTIRFRLELAMSPSEFEKSLEQLCAAVWRAKGRNASVTLEVTRMGERRRTLRSLDAVLRCLATEQAEP